MPLPSFSVTGNLNEIPGVVVASELLTTALTATLQFTPNIKPTDFVVWESQIYRVDPVSVWVSGDGSISDMANPVRLLANDDGLNVSGLQWKVTITTPGVGQVEWWFAAPGDGETVDLATVIPVPPVNAVGISRGPRGYPGMDYAFVTTFNVKDAAYGAVGNGSTDDTTACQAAINACAAAGGGIVLFPPSSGSYVFSTFTVPVGVYLEGGGYSYGAHAAFGNAQYNEGNAAAPKGSVLRSTATSGTAITFDADNFQPYRMHRLCVVGPGSGTSTGVSLVSSVGSYFDDVAVLNFSRGWLIDDSYDSTFSHLRAMGCQVGMELDNFANQNTFPQTEIQFSSTTGLLITEGSQNVFLGLLLQNTAGAASLRHVSGEGNVYSNVYHETTLSLTNAIKLEAGSFNVFTDWWFSDLDAQITITGGADNEFHRFNNGTGVQDVAVSSGAHLFGAVKGAWNLTGATAADCRIWDPLRHPQLTNPKINAIHDSADRIILDLTSQATGGSYNTAFLANRDAGLPPIFGTFGADSVIPMSFDLKGGGAAIFNGDVIAGNLIASSAGKGLYIKEGTNAKMGVATLVGGAVTVSTTAVAATSRIFVTVQSLGTVAAPKAVAVTARSAGTSFTITSADATDTSVVAWTIVTPY